MPAAEVITDSQLRLVLDMGMDIDGNVIYKNKNFNNVKPTSTADQLYAIAQALAPLQQHPMVTIERNNSYDVINQA